MTYLCVMPYTYEPYMEQCVDSMADEFFNHVLPVNNTVENKGAAGSYNIGARRVLEEGLDWLITLSPSTRFGPKGGLDFAEFLDSVPDAWIVEADVPVQWHLIAWHRRVFETIGLWDEHFWPVYGEDADISHRILTAMDEMNVTNAWHVFPADAWITMQGYSAHKGGVMFDQTDIWNFYERKWGGRSGQEKFPRPYNNPALGLDYVGDPV